jgi:imidazolonepropionase-like amidohydrolase
MTFFVVECRKKLETLKKDWDSEEATMSDYSQTNFVKEHLPGKDARTELKNGRFVDVINGTYFSPEVRLIIEGGRIKSMPGLPGEPKDIKPDFTIDIKGKTVLPGFFNTHCHMNMMIISLVPHLRDIRLGKKFSEVQKARNMAECLAHGVTTIRDAYSEDLRSSWTLREMISTGKIPGPRFLQSVVVGPPNSYLAEKYGLAMRLLGASTLDHNRREAGVVEFPVNATEQQVRDAVNRAIDERGAEVIKIGEQRESLTNVKPILNIMTLAQLQALADQARRRGVKSMIHHVTVESFRRGVKAGVSSLAHVASDSHLTKEDVDAFKAAGCVIDPTISVRYGIVWKIKGDQWYNHPEMNKLTDYRDKTYKFASLAHDYYIPELRDPIIRSYKKASTGDFKAFGIINIARLFKYYSRAISYGLDNFRLLFEQGVRMSLSNDAGVTVCTPAMIDLELNLFDFDLNGEVGGKRFDGAKAARIATIDSAYSMGLEKEYGSIEKGKIADLAIVDGNPLTDLHVIGRRVAALFMDGKLLINNCGLQVERVGPA